MPDSSLERYLADDLALQGWRPIRDFRDRIGLSKEVFERFFAKWAKDGVIEVHNARVHGQGTQAFDGDWIAVRKPEDLRRDVYAILANDAAARLATWDPDAR